MENGALFGKYEVGRLLGCGAFAKVYYARNLRNGGQSVAIKVINKKKIAGTSLMSNIKREITIMRRLRHPNIVRLHEVLATKSKIYFVMDLVKGGELFAKVAKGRFTEDLSRNYFQQLISAVGYCHSRGVYHRDLKPENLLVDENGDLKVTDFGLSAFKEQDGGGDSLLHTLCGTPSYVAPEILAKKGYDGANVDVWSCGIILFVLTAGYLPFNDPNLMAMYKKIYKGEFRCPKWMSSDLKRFLSRLLDTNPKTRLTVDQITRDPWFTKGGVFKDQPPGFVFPFHHHHQYTNFYDREKQAFDNDGGNDNEHEQSPQHLNAFDLISFSSGLDLSGLLDHSFNPGDRFLSAQPAHKILDKLEQVCRAHNVKLKRDKDFVVDIQGPNHNFIAKLEISPLTDQVLVVEVKKRGGDSASFNLIWNTKLRPDLSDLVHHPQPSPPPDTGTTSPPDDPVLL